MTILPNKPQSVEFDHLYKAKMPSSFRNKLPTHTRLAIFMAIMMGLACLCASCHASEHFKNKEFSCSCCHKVKVDPHLVVMLEKLRHELGDTPIVITSGYRCPRHNKKVGGVKNSQHLYGKAADIRVKNYTPAEVAHFAKMVGFGYIKVYRSWVHVDVR